MTCISVNEPPPFRVLFSNSCIVVIHKPADVSMDGPAPRERDCPSSPPCFENIHELCPGSSVSAAAENGGGTSSGVVSPPSSPRLTVLSWGYAYMREKGFFDARHDALEKQQRRKKQLKFVHQLDYGTSGILCLAFEKAAAAKLAHCFEMRVTKKWYLAILDGCAIPVLHKEAVKQLQDQPEDEKYQDDESCSNKRVEKENEENESNRKQAVKEIERKKRVEKHEKGQRSVGTPSLSFRDLIRFTGVERGLTDLNDKKGGHSAGAGCGSISLASAEERAALLNSFYLSCSSDVYEDEKEAETKIFLPSFSSNTTEDPTAQMKVNNNNNNNNTCTTGRAMRIRRYVEPDSRASTCPSCEQRWGGRNATKTCAVTPACHEGQRNSNRYPPSPAGVYSSSSLEVVPDRDGSSRRGVGNTSGGVGGCTVCDAAHALQTHTLLRISFPIAVDDGDAKGFRMKICGDNFRKDIKQAETYLLVLSHGKGPVSGAMQQEEAEEKSLRKGKRGMHEIHDDHRMHQHGRCPQENKGGTTTYTAEENPQNREVRAQDEEKGKALRSATVEPHKRERGVTRVLLIPFTGRRHQLRLHMWALQQPILGDTTYASVPHPFSLAQEQEENTNVRGTKKEKRERGYNEDDEVKMKVELSRPTTGDTEGDGLPPTPVTSATPAGAIHQHHASLHSFSPPLSSSPLVPTTTMQSDIAHHYEMPRMCLHAWRLAIPHVLPTAAEEEEKKGEEEKEKKKEKERVEARKRMRRERLGLESALINAHKRCEWTDFVTSDVFSSMFSFFPPSPSDSSLESTI